VNIDILIKESEQEVLTNLSKQDGFKFSLMLQDHIVRQINSILFDLNNFGDNPYKKEEANFLLAQLKKLDTDYFIETDTKGQWRLGSYSVMDGSPFYVR